MSQLTTGKQSLFTRVLYASHNRVCHGRFQIQALLPGTASFDPGRYHLTHLSTQDCETIEMASLIVVPAQTHNCASSLSTIDCSFQGLLAHSSLGYKIEIRQDPIQHVSSQRFRADIGLIVVSFHLSGSYLAICHSSLQPQNIGVSNSSPRGNTFRCR